MYIYVYNAPVIYVTSVTTVHPLVTRMSWVSASLMRLRFLIAEMGLQIPFSNTADYKSAVTDAKDSNLQHSTSASSSRHKISNPTHGRMHSSLLTNTILLYLP